MAQFWPVFIVKILPDTLMFTMAIDDVLPFSNLLSNDLLQFFDNYESSSSITIPVPDPPPEMDSVCSTLPPPSSIDVLNKLKLLKRSASVTPRGKLSLTSMCGIAGAGVFVTTSLQKSLERHQ